MTRLFSFAAFIFLLSLTSCNSDQSEKTTIQHESADTSFNALAAKGFLDSVNTKFSEQVALGDSAALASHYWPDAELLLDNSETVKGSDIASAWGAAIRMGLKEMTFITSDIKGSSTLLIETGNYEMKGEKKSLIDRGKYVVIWEKRNNQWKLYRDIGCTSLPLPK